jgi:cbb3-type cytochrome oxidase cytochrome c subunit
MTARARARYALAIAASCGLLTAVITGCTSPRPGAVIFKEEGCVVCHHHSGTGNTTGNGPIDLTRVSERRTNGWIREHIINPKIHDPNIGMPSFAHLSHAEITSLIEFLKKGEG